MLLYSNWGKETSIPGRIAIATDVDKMGSASNCFHSVLLCWFRGQGGRGHSAAAEFYGLWAYLPSAILECRQEQGVFLTMQLLVKAFKALEEKCYLV